MNKAAIDQLLQKYWDAETNLEEERTLAAYFSTEDIHPTHEIYASLFGYYKAEREVTSNNIDLDKIDFGNDENRNVYGYFRLSPWKMGIAASFILALAYLGGLNISEQDRMAGFYVENSTIYDEDAEMQEAYEVTKQALSMLSSKLKSSQKTVSENLNEIKKVDLMN